jgi:hypothetical protein
MSGKNRAFALAVATAALVGLSAPVASAATSQDGPSGFNNDSVLNVSGNQLPTQTCTSGAPVNTVTSTQTITSALASIVPTISTGDVSPMQGNTCTQSTTETNTTTANTAPTAAASENAHSHRSMSRSEGSDPSSDPSTSGFNNDSVVNLSGNQLPVQTCTSGAAVNTVTETQALTSLLSILPVLSTGAVSPMQGNTCTQSTTETNATTANTGS